MFRESIELMIEYCFQLLFFPSTENETIFIDTEELWEATNARIYLVKITAPNESCCI